MRPAVLRARWESEPPGWAAPEPDPRLAPFSRQFPGLAPPELNQLNAAQRHQVLSSLPPAHIGLIAAPRPADALPTAGWVTFDDDRAYDFHGPDPVLPPVWIAAVLRSWEDRFGATLLNVGPNATIRLLVERSPASRDAAQRIAAEHSVFADAWNGNLRSDIETITTSLIDTPIWQFWWD